MSLVLSAVAAEEFRGKFTEELARVGFDKNYEITAEGEVLENLIDRFFVSCRVGKMPR